MILGWILLFIAMALTGALSYSFVRLVVDEQKCLPRRHRDPLVTRAKRLGRAVVEPAVGR